MLKYQNPHHDGSVVELELFQDIPVDTATLEGVERGLREDGCVYTTDAVLGLSGIHKALNRPFQELSSFSPEKPGIHLNRYRKRDVIKYEILEPEAGSRVLRLSEHPERRMPPRADETEPREYNHEPLLELPEFPGWLGAYLCMIPEERRLSQGTVGVDLIRTERSPSKNDSGNVVLGMHRDRSRYGLIYLTDRDNVQGAATSVHPANDPRQMTVQAELDKGKYLLLDDERVLHDVTPIQLADEAKPAYRNAYIMLVHEPGEDGRIQQAHDDQFLRTQGGN